MKRSNEREDISFAHRKLKMINRRFVDDYKECCIHHKTAIELRNNNDLLLSDNIKSQAR